jgi:hypothetical protein
MKTYKVNLEKSEKSNYQVLTINEMRKVRGGGDIVDPFKKI